MCLSLFPCCLWKFFSLDSIARPCIMIDRWSLFSSIELCAAIELCASVPSVPPLLVCIPGNVSFFPCCMLLAPVNICAKFVGTDKLLFSSVVLLLPMVPPSLDTQRWALLALTQAVALARANAVVCSFVCTILSSIRIFIVVFIVSELSFVCCLCCQQRKLQSRWLLSLCAHLCFLSRLHLVAPPLNVGLICILLAFLPPASNGKKCNYFIHHRCLE